MTAQHAIMWARLRLVCVSLTVIAASLAAGLPGFAGMGVAAQQAPRIASVTFEPQEATVGDRLTLTIAIAHDAGDTITGPGFDADFGSFEIIDIATPRTDTGNGQTTTTLVYTLTAFATGRATLPPLAVTYRGAAGEGALTTPEHAVEIVSVLAPGETELRPLKPQLEFESGAPSPLVPATFVALFALLTGAGYVLLSRAIASRPLALPVVVPPTAPHVAARADLDALARTDLAEHDPNGYYAAIAAIMRRYLSARFAFPAYAMTRRELDREMRRAGIDRWPARLTSNVLEQCDAVQFAGFRPAAPRRDADLTAAYEIIDLTAPPDPGA